MMSFGQSALLESPWDCLIGSAAMAGAIQQKIRLKCNDKAQSIISAPRTQVE